MIRIIYRWQVAPEQLKAFRQTWQTTTNKIHQNVPGAQGSFFLQHHANPSEVLTIARWDSLDSWKAFFDGASLKWKGAGQRSKRLK